MAERSRPDGNPRPRESRDAHHALLKSLARASDAGRRRRLLVAASHLHGADTVRRLHEEALRLARVDLERAERLAQAARWLADRVGDRVPRARSLRAAGHILSLRGRYRRALAHYTAALALLVEPDDDLERAITLSGALQTLIYLGDYERAHAWAYDARLAFEALGDTLRLARLDMNVGNILYREDRFKEALSRYRSAQEILTRIGDAQDAGIVLRNIAVCWISLNDFPAALAAHDAARRWCIDHDMPLLVAEIDYNVAYLHYLRGEYGRSIELYQAARAYCARVGDRYHRALCDLDQSEMYLELNLNEGGGQLAAQAAGAFKALGMRYETGKAHVNMGIAAWRRSDRNRALQLFEQARRLFEHERNRHWLMVTDVYRALTLAESDEVDDARRLARSALRHFRRHGPPGKAALCELLLARLAKRDGRLAEARATAEDAIRLAETAEATALCARGYLVLGEVHEASGDADTAYAVYRHADAAFEILRNHLGGDHLKIAFLEDKRAVYEALVSLALAREPEMLRARVAFRYIEQAKSRGLAEVMAFGPTSPPPASRATGIARQLDDLRKELTWWRRKAEAHELVAAPTHAGSRERRASAAMIRERARDCEVRLARAQAEMELADAEFCVLSNGTALPLEALRSSIPPDTALVEYYEARGRVLGCVLTSRQLHIVPLAASGEVRTLLRLLQFQMSKFRLDRRYAERFSPALLQATMAHLQDLHTALVGPLLPHLSAARHLVIAPHDALHYLPWHALFDGKDFLLDRFSVSYAPSATVYHLCRTRTAEPGAHSLVLGVADERAPQIAAEIEAVSHALPDARVYVGREATAERLHTDGRTARYVHIATHGLFRQDNPMFSAVRLGDGELSLLDLYQLRLAAELVTLSGCGTGLAAVMGGDELVGLTRGLLYAGARSVLVTLWDVNDGTTATFMQSFYRHLALEPHKGRACASAMREVRVQHPHPYFWAPFALIGDPDGSPVYQGAGPAPLVQRAEPLIPVPGRM